MLFVAWICVYIQMLYNNNKRRLIYRESKTYDRHALQTSK